MTTSQDLDKSARRRPRPWFRRRAIPAPGADGARARMAASRRVVQLEMELAAKQSRLDRLATQCTPPCWHAVRQQAAELELQRLRAQQSGIYAHICDVLDQALAATTDRPARVDETGGRR